MRIILLIIVQITSISLGAQTQLPLNGMNITQRGGFTPAFTPYNAFSNSNNLQKKWSLYKYAGISASYMFSNGGNATVFSAPIGLQLNRRLNNNLYAFAGISAAPAYINFNASFMHSDIYKNNPGTTGLSTNGFGLYSRFEAGLMYINDDRTFSISGSIGIERGSYPLYPPYNTTNLQKPQPVSGSRQ